MSRHGRINRDSEGRAVPAADEVAKLAHRLRYHQEQVFSRDDYYFTASCLDTLCCLAGALDTYGKGRGRKFREKVLALMMEAQARDNK